MLKQKPRKRTEKLHKSHCKKVGRKGAENRQKIRKENKNMENEYMDDIICEVIKLFRKLSPEEQDEVISYARKRIEHNEN